MKGLAPGMRVVGLFAVLALIAALEYGAGVAAGWGRLAYLLPLAIDTFVLGVLLAEQSRLADRLFALGLVEFTVVVSAVAGGHEGNVLLGGVLATALVLTLWRQDETIRRERRSREVPTAAREVQWQAQLTRTEPPAPPVNVPAQPVSIPVDEPAAEPDRTAEAPPQRGSVTVPDDELDAIIRAALAANAKAGFGTVEKAIKDAGWLVGNTERVKDALRAQKQPGLRVVAGGQ